MVRQVRSRFVQGGLLASRQVLHVSRSAIVIEVSSCVDLRVTYTCCVISLRLLYWNNSSQSISARLPYGLRIVCHKVLLEDGNICIRFLFAFCVTCVILNNVVQSLNGSFGVESRSCTYPARSEHAWKSCQQTAHDTTNVTKEYCKLQQSNASKCT
jgi:hypothetical protein